MSHATFRLAAIALVVLTIASFSVTPASAAVIAMTDISDTGPQSGSWDNQINWRIWVSPIALGTSPLSDIHLPSSNASLQPSSVPAVPQGGAYTFYNSPTAGTVTLSMYHDKFGATIHENTTFKLTIDGTPVNLVATMGADAPTAAYTTTPGSGVTVGNINVSITQYTWQTTSLFDVANGVSSTPSGGNGAHISGSVTFLVSLPEPASLSLLAVGGLSLLRRRRAA